MTHNISDLTSRIRNAYAARRDEVCLPYSGLTVAVAKVLVEAGYLNSLEIEGKAPFQEVVLKLKYQDRHVPVVTGIRMLSTPGRRLYSSTKKIPKALGGYGITIVTTNQGVMTDVQARKLNVGGELLCQVW